MDLLFSLSWPMCFIPPVGLYMLSRRGVFGPLRGSAVHPFNIAGFFFIFIALNMLYIFQVLSAGGVVYFGRTMITSVSDLMRGQAFFLLMEVSTLAGVAFATLRKTFGMVPTEPTARDLRACLIVFWCALFGTAAVAALIVDRSMSNGSLFYVAATRQTFFRDSPVLLVICSTLVPAAIIAISGMARPASRWLLALMAVVVLFPLGSRGAMLYIIIALLTAAVVRGRRLPVMLLYLGAPVIGVLLVWLRYLRESTQGIRLDTYLDANSGALIFGSLDFSTAQAIVLGASHDIVQRFPGETLLGMLLAVIPRSIIPWKPEGPSAEFSAVSDLVRWESTKSEWVITGFVNLKVEFGIVFAAVAMLFLAYLWARILITYAQRSGMQFIMAAAILSIAAYIFVRGDLYNLALFLWPLAVVVLAKRAVELVSSIRAYEAVAGRPPRQHIEVTR